MSYLNFDKTLLTNLEKSLSKEMLRTNRAGTYNSTTIVDCNTRKYHGQLVVPLPQIDNTNHVLLSSLDETVIQHGAEFNLGVHKYQGNHYNPNGHRYIRQFDCESIYRTVYRVGGVVLAKERMLVSYEPRILIKYTLLEAHSATKLQFKPFLAFRSVNELTQQNGVANTNYEETKNGISTKMYENYPQLYMQFSKTIGYNHQPDWYKGIEYHKEQERGYAYKEDLFVPGTFELPIKKGESIIFSAGITETSPNTLKRLWDKELKRRNDRLDMFANLKNAAQQFYKREADKTYLLAGYPWFNSRARDQFISLVPATLMIGREDYFYDIIDTSIQEIESFIEGERNNLKLEGITDPDVLLWFVRTIQQYAELYSIKEAKEKYGYIVEKIINFIRKQNHPNLFVHNSGLLFTNGTDAPATWMNAVENGKPITPRTGYVVEINALWYNALKFHSELEKENGENQSADLSNYQAELLKDAFIETFWNGTYLYDYVIDNYKDHEVRSNMIIAVGLPYSPLNRQQQKSILDITTKELLTPKGLRTLSPKSGSYRPEYMGGMQERNWNYHSGPVWTWTIGYFADTYFKIYKQSGISFIERLLMGIESEMTELGIGTISELFDGNPPFGGHGGMSFAMNVAEVIRVIQRLKKEQKTLTDN